MTAKFTETGIDWAGTGYFGCPDPAVAVQAPSLSDPWRIWFAVLHAAKAGNFSRVPELAKLLTTTSDRVLAACCTDVLGDAGTASSFTQLVMQLERTEDFETAANICNALYLRGLLKDVPAMLSTYERFSSVSDADIIPVWIGDLLGGQGVPLSEPTSFGEPEDYHDAVMSSYKQCVDALGGETIFVFGGKRFGVRTFAQRILDRVRKPFARTILRHKFEASTGIDCSSFYKQGSLRPLNAAAVVEQFLQTPQADKYQEGVRYFFGHRLPD